MSQRRHNKLTVWFRFEACDNTKALLFKSEALLGGVIETGHRLMEAVKTLSPLNLFRKFHYFLF